MNLNNPKVKTLFGVLIGTLVNVLIFFWWLGPNYGAKHAATVENGTRGLPEVQQILKVFSGAEIHHFITHFGHDESKPVLWNTVVFFDGRYILSYQSSVIVDYRKDTIKQSVGDPTFYLKEVASYKDGTEIYGEQWRFGAKEWQQVATANGDFTATGIILKKNAPTPGFEELIQSARAARQ